MNESAVDIDLSSVLLSRLSWPLRVVRLETARQVARLLARDDPAFKIQFLRWMKSQKTETQSAAALAVIALAGDGLSLTLEDCLAHINKPSLLCDMYLAAIYGEQAIPVDITSAHSGRAPDDFFFRPDFKRIVGETSAPILYNRCKQLEVLFGFPFLKQFEFEYRELDCEIIKPDQSLNDFLDRGFRNMAFSGDPPGAEVMRSAYVRTIHFAADIWGMPPQLAYEYAAYAAPINLSLMSLKPMPRPDWWPYQKTLLTAEQAGLSLPELSLDPSGEEVPIAACGVLHMGEYNWLEANYIATTSNEDPIRHPKQVPDLEIGNALSLPSILDASDVLESCLAEEVDALFLQFRTAASWQVPITLRGLWVPNPVFLGEALEVRAKNDEVTYHCAGEQIGRLILWYSPWNTSRPRYALGSVSTALLMSRKALRKMLAQNSMTLWKSAEWMQCPDLGHDWNEPTIIEPVECQLVI